MKPGTVEIWAELRAIASRHWCTEHTILSRSNLADHVAARREAALYLRSLGYSYPSIGRWLGGRHHTTAMNLCKGRGYIPVRLTPLPAVTECRSLAPRHKLG